ncbi:MAG: hypothetical protein ACK4YU_04365 [Paracoccus sp. (in: a-proteobacteria)]
MDGAPPEQGKMKMKTFVFALTALTLATGTAMAASNTTTHERPSFEMQANAARLVEVPAGSVMTSRELRQAGLRANDLVSVTLISTSEETADIDNSGRGF